MFILINCIAEKLLIWVLVGYYIFLYKKKKENVKKSRQK